MGQRTVLISEDILRQFFIQGNHIPPDDILVIKGIPKDVTFIRFDWERAHQGVIGVVYSHPSWDGNAEINIIVEYQREGREKS